VDIEVARLRIRLDELINGDGNLNDEWDDEIDDIDDVVDIAS